MKKIAFAFVAAATFAVVPAFAQDATATATATTAAPASGGGGEKEFGNPGVLHFAAATSLNFGVTSSKPPQGDSSSRTEISILPSIDYFVIEGLSVGGEILFNMTSDKPAGASDSNKSTTIGIGPRVGYNIWVQPGSLSVWPLVGFSYRSTSTSAGGQDGPSTSRGTLGIFVPLVIHPVKHFDIGIGPYVDLDVMSKSKPPNGDSVDGNKDTTFGLKAEIGGWL